MSVSKKLCFVVLNLWFVLACNAKVDYFNTETWPDQEHVDPHSFYYDKHTQEEILRPEDGESHEIAEYKDCESCYKQLQKCRKAHNTDVADELLSRRFINMLISRARWEEDGWDFVGHIELRGSQSDIEALKNFGLGKLKLREIDPILNKIVLTLQNETASNIRSVVATFASHIWFFLVNACSLLLVNMLEYKEITIGILASLPFCYFLKSTRINILCKLLICIFAVSFLITWWKLVQDAQIKHTAAQMRNMNMPSDCQPDEKRWKWLSFWYNTGDCEKYVESMMREPLIQVTPAQALSHMFTNFIFEPIALSGKAISVFLENVTGHMPWPLSWGLQSALILGFVPAVILVVILLLGGTLSIGPFSMLSLRGSRNSAPRQSEKERQPIEVILNITSNLQLPHNVVSDASRSSDLAITACPVGCDESKKENLGPRKAITANENLGTRKAITADEKAGGDCESTTKSEPPKDSVDAENEPEVPNPKIVESGSGDNNFTFL